ncbi:MAG: hypothetical protein ABJ331_05365 [Marinobacter sp.]|uniref:hypothetical protein n=1 Tax=Marinobacter sp. TaxID=50741 RepID=UPI0032996683
MVETYSMWRACRVPSTLIILEILTGLVTSPTPLSNPEKATKLKVTQNSELLSTLPANMGCRRLALVHTRHFVIFNKMLRACVLPSTSHSLDATRLLCPPKP